MRAVVQRVTHASVTVDDEIIGEIDKGLLVLVGVGQQDTPQARAWVLRKILDLRIFPDADGRMNHSVTDLGGALLLVSQFTLYGDVRKGRRPSFVDAMAPGDAECFFEAFVDEARQSGLRVATGRFGADMQVQLTNDGPVTILIDSDHRS